MTIPATGQYEQRAFNGGLAYFGPDGKGISKAESDLRRPQPAPVEPAGFRFDASGGPIKYWIGAQQVTAFQVQEATTYPLDLPALTDSTSLVGSFALLRTVAARRQLGAERALDADSGAQGAKNPVDQQKVSLGNESLTRLGSQLARMEAVQAKLTSSDMQALRATITGRFEAGGAGGYDAARVDQLLAQIEQR